MDLGKFHDNNLGGCRGNLADAEREGVQDAVP
jgi:hypothetical protein